VNLGDRARRDGQPFGVVEDFQRKVTRVRKEFISNNATSFNGSCRGVSYFSYSTNKSHRF
jgi:hypothetical protein